MSNNRIYDRCNSCEHFQKQPLLYGNRMRSRYDCLQNPEHRPRPNRKACETYKRKFTPEVGDYCRYYQTIIDKDGETIRPCTRCQIRCLYSVNKKEANHLVRK